MTHKTKSECEIMISFRYTWPHPCILAEWCWAVNRYRYVLDHCDRFFTISQSFLSVCQSNTHAHTNAGSLLISHTSTLCQARSPSHRSVEDILTGGACVCLCLSAGLGSVKLTVMDRLTGFCVCVFCVLIILKRGEVCLFMTVCKEYEILHVWVYLCACVCGGFNMIALTC